jgi:hypothetical protein
LADFDTSFLAKPSIDYLFDTHKPAKISQLQIWQRPSITYQKPSITYDIPSIGYAKPSIAYRNPVYRLRSGERNI